MTIKFELVKRMRVEKGWSQEALSEMSGLSLRTIQRMESGSNVSLETLKILADTFGISSEDLLEKEDLERAIQTPLDAVRQGFKEYANFSGRATRYEYWWFLLFIVIVMAIATIIHEKVGMIVDLVLLVPLLAVSARRLNDIGESLVWLFLMFIPFGQFIILFIMAKPTKPGQS